MSFDLFHSDGSWLHDALKVGVLLAIENGIKRDVAQAITTGIQAAREVPTEPPARKRAEFAWERRARLQKKRLEARAIAAANPKKRWWRR